jgi:hypothetical protein
MHTFPSTVSRKTGNAETVQVNHIPMPLIQGCEVMGAVKAVLGIAASAPLVGRLKG